MAMKYHLLAMATIWFNNDISVIVPFSGQPTALLQSGAYQVFRDLGVQNL